MTDGTGDPAGAEPPVPAAAAGQAPGAPDAQLREVQRIGALSLEERPQALADEVRRLEAALETTESQPFPR